MPWLRLGDTSSTHPLVFHLLEVCQGDRKLQLEAWGFLVMAATVSAAHLSDYVVSQGLAESVAPGRSKDLAAILIASGLMEPIEIDGRPMYKIVEAEDLIHMRRGEEVELDRARKRDSRRPDLVIPVRIRDGDRCRWCGKTVNFADHKSARGGVIDSLTGHKNSTIETLVVGCRACNTRREIDGHEMTLLSEPTREDVYYTDSTIAYINNSEYAHTNGITLTPRQTRLEFAQAAPSTGASAPSPVEPAAPSTQGPSALAPDANGTEPPEWLTMPLDELCAQQEAARQQTAAPPTAAPSTGASAPAPAAPPQQGKSAPPQAAPGHYKQRQDAPPNLGASAPAAPIEDPRAPGRSGAENQPITECNETVKPNPKSKPDPDRRADRSSLSGTGRDGTGLVGSDLSSGSPSGQSLPKKKRRGRRGGKRRR